MFEDNTLNQDGSRKSSRYLDLSKGPYACEHELVSPKASALNRPELMVSSEKNENQPSDVPVAQIVIPTIKKIEISNSKVEAKSGVSEYKSKLTSVSSALEQAKSMPFRTKKMSLARSNVSGSSFGLHSRVSKIPHSNQKAQISGSKSGGHFISAQKSQDPPKHKLFGERRTSTNTGLSLKGLGNESVSLRIQSGLRSSHKSNIGAGTYNLSNQKSQKFLGN